MEVPFIDGVPNGICKEYYESGELEYETPYVNGVIHGKQVTYEPFEVYHKPPKRDKDDPFEEVEEATKVVPDADWVYKFETPYENGIKQGLGFGYYYTEIVAFENQFENDAWVYQKEFYTSGKIQSEVAYLNEQKNGIERIYHESGELADEVPYLANTIHGIRVIYHRKEIYKDGWHIDRTSPHDYPDSIEGAITKIPYVNGVKNGIETTHSSDGTLLYEVEWKDGRRIGKGRTFFTDGELYKEAIYLYDLDDGYSIVETYPMGQIGTDASLNHWFMPRRDIGSIKVVNDRTIYQYEFEGVQFGMEIIRGDNGAEVSRAHFKGCEYVLL